DFSKPFPDLWAKFDALAGVPLLAIRGGNSKLLSALTLEEMGRRHPGMETITAEGQGHAPFLETGNLPREIADFLDRAERKSK
ncbi:MAG: alpha/beta hydrolase, partial [Mesorhizobium sp.]